MTRARFKWLLVAFVGAALSPATCLVARADDYWFEQRSRYIGSSTGATPSVVSISRFGGSSASATMPESTQRGDYGASAAVSSSTATVTNGANNYITSVADGEIVLHPDSQQLAGFAQSETNGTVVHVIDSAYIGRGIYQSHGMNTYWELCTDGDPNSSTDVDVTIVVNWDTTFSGSPWGRGDSRYFDLRIEGLGVSVYRDMTGNLVGSGPGGMSASKGGFAMGSSPSLLEPFRLEGTVSVPVGTIIRAVGHLDKDSSGQPVAPYSFAKTQCWFGPTYNTTANDSGMFSTEVSFAIANP